MKERRPTLEKRGLLAAFCPEDFRTATWRRKKDIGGGGGGRD